MINTSMICQSCVADIHIILENLLQRTHIPENPLFGDTFYIPTGRHLHKRPARDKMDCIIHCYTNVAIILAAHRNALKVLTGSLWRRREWPHSYKAFMARTRSEPMIPDPDVVACY